MKILIIIIIAIAVASLIFKIRTMLKNNTNSGYTSRNKIPPNYRVSPWTSDWLFPIYKCEGCENLKRFIKDGKWQNGCKLYGIYISPEKVCDDYVERDPLPSFRQPGDVWKPFTGHLDEPPERNSENN